MSNDYGVTDVAFWQPKLAREERFTRAMSWIEGTRRDYETRRVMLDEWHRIYYANTSLYYGDTTTYTNAPSLGAAKSACDTLVNIILAEEPRCRVLPVDGEWSDHRKTRQLQRFIDGTLDGQGFYSDLRPRVLYDAAIYGLGIIQVGSVGDEVTLERVWCGDLIVDEYNSIMAEPVVLGRVRHVPVHALARQYKGHADAIYRSIATAPSFMRAGAASADSISSSMSYMTEVFDLWFCTGLPGDKGYFLRLVAGGDPESCVLEAEDLASGKFPMVPTRLFAARNGYFGQSAIGICAFEQDHSDRLEDKIQSNMELSSNLVISVEAGTIDAKKFTNRPCMIMERTPGSQPPQFSTPPSVSSEVYMHQQFLIQRAMDKLGVSALTAYGKKPPDVEASVALQELQDIESVRLSQSIKADSNAIVALAQRIVETAIDRFSNDGVALKTRYTTDVFAKTIKWDDIDLERDKFTISMMPSALLPRTPGAKLGRVGYLFQSGLLDREEALSLLDSADLQRKYAVSTAIQDSIDKAAEIMLYDGEQLYPDNFLSNDFAIARMSSLLYRAEVDGATRDRLELVENWINAAIENRKTMVAMQQAQAAPPPGPAMPQGPAPQQQPQMPPSPEQPAAMEQTQ